MLAWTEYIKIFTALLSIVDPIGAVPILVSLTVGMGRKERTGIASTTSVAVGMILVGAALFGKLILNLFGISIASFKIGGGIIILLMAVAMMQARYAPGRQTTEEAQEAEEKKSIAVVPIAMPLLAGPGAISTVIVYSQSSFDPLHIVLIVLICILVALLTWLVLRAADTVVRKMSRTAINIVTRLMGLLLAAISAELITGGLAQIFPALTK
ncbi:MAG: NAAT family transporter [Nitrospirota bacterium]